MLSQNVNGPNAEAKDFPRQTGARERVTTTSNVDAPFGIAMNFSVAGSRARGVYGVRVMCVCAKLDAHVRV